MPDGQDDRIRANSFGVMLRSSSSRRCCTCASTRASPACSSRPACRGSPTGRVLPHRLDGYNVLLVLLTAFLGPLVVAGAFSAIQKDIKLFYSMVFLHPSSRCWAPSSRRTCCCLHLLETMLIPMVPDHRHLGGEAAHLRDPEVRAVHGVRLDPDAGGADLPGVVAVPGKRHAVVRLHRPVRRPAERAEQGWMLAASRCRSPSGGPMVRCTPGCPTRTSRRRPPAA